MFTVKLKNKKELVSVPLPAMKCPVFLNKFIKEKDLLPAFNF